MKSSYFLQQARYRRLNVLLFKFSRAKSSTMRVLDILHGIYRLFDDKGNFIKHLDIGDLCKYNYYVYKTWVLKSVKDESMCFSVKEGRRYK